MNRAGAKAHTGEDKPITYPAFVTEGDDEESASEIIDRMRKSFDRTAKAAAARRWYKIHIGETKPYAILWFGDPHLGPNCNWPLLERHIAIGNQDGVYSAGIGDVTDNFPWTGKLARVWAEKDISSKSERKLAEWFMFDAGLRWALFLLGNHDAWNGGTAFYQKLGAFDVPVVDWRAQFVICHNGGKEVRVDAAHGRKGYSYLNPSHGTLRAARDEEHADLFVTGHIHSYKLDHFEHAGRKQLSWLAQVRGYKFHDHYTMVSGFHEYEMGSAIMSIIDPVTGRVQCFGDPEEGADYLKWKRR